jgi:hypothetical protein
MPNKERREEIERLKKILDNPFAKKTEDRFLESVRRRLTPTSYEFPFEKTLEPRVTIHEPPIHKVHEPPILKHEPPILKPEREDFLDVEDLYEIEKVEEEEESLPEWEPVEEEPLKPDIKKAFQGIKSIDEKTAGLLYTHGYTSIKKIRDATLKDLCRIISKKQAKKIKKEVETESEWESYPIENFTRKDYTLYEKEIEVSPGKKRTIRFFSKETPEDAEPIPLPEGYEVKVNKKTGLPYLKKKAKEES